VIRRLLSALVRAELVKAQKGANGGFCLARPQATISMRDIYRAVEPDPNHGLSHFTPNHRCPVGAKIEGVLQGAFDKAQQAMERELAATTLAEIQRQLHTRGNEKGRAENL
jgi:Rrf2 family protein